MRKIAFIGLIVACATAAMAVPAKPGPTVITEADGTERTVYLHGDEFFHYMTLADGKWVEMQSGRLATVPALSEEEIATRHDQQQAAAAPLRAPAATTQAIPLNIAPRGLIILAQFTDLEFRAANTLEAFQEMYDSEDYSFNGATGSAKKYFEDQSFGQYSPEFEVVGPVTVSNSHSYYGANDHWGNDSRPNELIIEACRLADTEWDIDFTQYDNDNDGFIDFVYVIYAGRGEADGGPTTTIWPHTSYIYERFGQTIYLDGKKLNTYACSNELRTVTDGMISTARCGIGTFCHEFSHVLGLMDHYSTNSSNTSKQTGDWDLMCSGSYNNGGNTPAAYTAYERFYMGWGTPVILNEAVTIDSMQPIATSGEMYLISEDGTSNLVGNDPNPTTFYMLENRYQIGWDCYVPGNGLIITKIQYNYQKWKSNSVNASASSPGYDIIEADGKTPTLYEQGGLGKIGDAFPYTKTNSFSPYEHYPITDIKRNEGGTIFFKFMGGNDVISVIAKERALELYGEDFTEIVGVYDAAGHLIHGATSLNDLSQGMYIIAVSNGKKTKGVKLCIP